MKVVDYTLEHARDDFGTAMLFLYRFDADDPYGIPACCGVFKEHYFHLYCGRADINGETKYLEIDRNADSVMLEQILSEFGIWPSMSCDYSKPVAHVF